MGSVFILFEKIPLVPPSAAPGGGGIFSKYFENIPLFSKYFENWPIHVFKIATNPAFQRTIISAGTQDAILLGEYPGK